MKDKNKKILKSFGVGALACVGMVGLTGCANIDVSQDKVESMIETVEKVDGRLDEYIDLLEQQNQQLQEQNKLLEQSNRMTKEEVWNFAQTADFNLMMNINGLRDNLIVTAEERNLGLQQDLIVFYNSDSAKIFAELYDNENKQVELWYQTSDSNVILADITKNKTEYACDGIEDRGDEEDFESSVGFYRRTCPGINMFELTYEDLNHYEILENGNVKLTFVKYNRLDHPENDGEYILALADYCFEYSVEGKLLSFSSSSRIIEKEGDFGGNHIGMLEENTYNVGCILKYGAVDTELVESWVALAEAKRAE